MRGRCGEASCKMRGRCGEARSHRDVDVVIFRIPISPRCDARDQCHRLANAFRYRTMAAALDACGKGVMR